MRTDLLAALLGTAIVCTVQAAASPTTFTYQGQLVQDGTPAEGAHEFEIRLLDDLGVQIGTTYTASAVITAGAFAMELDFGNAAFDGSERYLEISVRSVADGGAYIVLSPNQLVTSTPVAQFALSGNEGPVGPVGPQGNQGNQGSSGNPGVDGSDGAVGAQGPQGNSGADGADGAPGAQGNQGAPGTPGDSHWGLNGSATYYNAGRVGIGTANPTAQFDISTTNNTAIKASTTGLIGVFGETSNTTGYGIFGNSVASTGINYGGRFSNSSTEGLAVFGGAFATSGANYGGRFLSSSIEGTGVYGFANANSGVNYGVYGKTNSPDGYAGYFTGGRNYFQGNVGIGTDSPNYPLHVETTAIRGVNASTSHSFGRGISGVSTATGGQNYGGFFENSSTGGRGVYSNALATSGLTYGGLFQNNSTLGRAVSGVANASSGQTYGGRFTTRSTEGVGVYGYADAVSGVNYGVYGKTNSSTGFAGYFEGGKNYFENRVGIGEDAPSDKLHVFSGANESAFRVQQNGATRFRVNASGGVSLGGNSTIVADGDVYVATNLGIGDSSPDARLDVVGNAVISTNLTVGTTSPSTTFKLNVSGTAGKTGGGSWAVFSDARLKKNITSMTGSLDVISALRPVNFEYTAKDHFSYTPGIQSGFIAQEVEQVIPQWVNTADDGYFYLDQVGYEALIVDAIQELRAEKDAEIQQLQARLDRLERMMTLSIDR